MIFLPVKPKYALAIHSKRKVVEFRKVKFKNEDTRYCLLYASTPIKRIIGYFELDYQEENTPDFIWMKYKKLGSISEEDFFSYFKNSKKAIAIVIKNYFPLQKEINPKDKIKNFVVPQSFRYLSRKELNDLIPNRIREKIELVQT